MSSKPPDKQLKLTVRDYLVMALIIIGVPVVWFLMVATFAGSAGLGLGFSITILISFVVYLALKRWPRKN